MAGERVVLDHVFTWRSITPQTPTPKSLGHAGLTSDSPDIRRNYVFFHRVVIDKGTDRFRLKANDVSAAQSLSENALSTSLTRQRNFPGAMQCEKDINGRYVASGDLQDVGGPPMCMTASWCATISVGISI